MKKFLEFIGDAGEEDPPFIDELFLVEDLASGCCQRLDEGKWVSGRFPRNIRLDHSTHGKGQQHAHVYGRKGEELVVVNLDGSASHGSRGRLHADDAAALRARGFPVADGGIIEWYVVGRFPMILG